MVIVVTGVVKVCNDYYMMHCHISSNVTPAETSQPICVVFNYVLYDMLTHIA